MKMNDSVLDIEATEDGTVFAALADGFVAVYQVSTSRVALSPGAPSSLLPQNISSESPDSDPDLFRIGSGPVSCLAVAPNHQVWCGCDRSITMMSVK